MGAPRREPARPADAAHGPATRDVLDLQRAAGNRAVQGLLESSDHTVAHALRRAPAGLDAVLARRGRTLDPGARAELEPIVGDDLSSVRIHDDATAARSAEAADAHAYTAGEDIVFGPGRYAPETGEGRALLAHEVGHVVTGRRQGTAGAAVMRQPKAGGTVRDKASLLTGVAAPRVSEYGSTTVATIYFAKDVFLMEADSFAAVQKLGKQLSYMAKPLVTVDGYASSEGSEERNEALARSRRDAVRAVLASAAPGVAVGGAGHGAREPAVAETAKDAAALEAQRAENRRVTIVISDLTTPAKPSVDIRDVPHHDETEQEAADRRLKEMLKLPADLSGPQKSWGEQGWKVFDDWLDGNLSKLGVPQQLRGAVKDGAHTLVEKGLEKALDSALDATPLGSSEKEAIKSALKAAVQTKH